MLNIFTKELKELFADKKIWIVILTVLIIIIIGTYYDDGKPEDNSSDLLRLGVINKDKSPYSDLLLKHFDESKTFSSLITVIKGNEEDIKSSFYSGGLDIYMEIPEDFADSMICMQHKPINVTINIKDTTKAILFKNILKSYEKYIIAVEANATGLYDIMEQDGMDQKLIDKTNNTISLDMILTALGKESFFSFHSVEKFPATKISDYYMISALIMAMMYIGLLSGLKLANEMKQGTILRLKTTKTSIIQLVAAKLILMTIILTILIMFIFHFISDASINLIYILFIISTASFCVAFSILLSTIFGTSQSYLLAGNLFVLFSLVLGGGIIPVQYLPQDIVRISRLMPNYYMEKGFILIKQGVFSKLNNIIAFFISASLLFAAAGSAFLYRRKMNYE